MAAQSSLSSEQVERLCGAVREGLGERGIHALVEMEESGLPGHYRIYVTAPEFERLTQGEREDTLWHVLHERWTREDQLRLTLTLTMSASEVAEGA